MNPELPTWYHRPGWVLSVTNRREVTVGETVNGEEYERGKPELDVKKNRVFVGSADRGLYALRAEDLSLIWRFQTLGPVQCEPLYDPGEDVVYFGSNDGALYKVKAETGELIYRFSSASEVARRPVLSGGMLYFTNANDTVVAIDPKTGELRWTQHRTPAFGMEIAGHAGPAVTQGKVIVPFSDGRVVAYGTEDGKERWAIDLAGEAESASSEAVKYLDADTTPVVAQTSQGALAYVGTYAGGVYGLDVSSGARVWGNERIRGVSEIALFSEPPHKPKDGGSTIPGRRMLLAASGTSGLWALDLEDGKEIWHRSLPESGVSMPVQIAGAIAIGTTRHGLFLVSAVDGAVIDGLDNGSGFFSSPAAFGRRLFALTNSGHLLSVHLDAPGSP